MPIFKTAQYQVRPESVDKCTEANREFIAYVKTNEPGTLRYTCLQRVDDPTSFMNFMIFQDAGAEEQHRKSEGVRRFTEILYPETVAGVAFTDYATVAST